MVMRSVLLNKSVLTEVRLPAVHCPRAVWLRSLLLVAALLATVSGVWAQTPVAPPLPVPHDAAGKLTPIGDYANVLDDATEQNLANILKNLKDRNNIDFAVVTTKTLDGALPYDYSLALMNGWGVGKQGTPGLLLLVAIDDRKYFTQVSRDLEGDLPDGLVGQIQRDNLIPLLRQNRYSEAISGTAQAFVGEIARKRGFSVEGLDQRYTRRQGAPSPPNQKKPLTVGQICMCFGLLVLVLIILAFVNRRGGGGGGGHRSGWGGGGFGGIPIPFPINIGGGGGGDSSGWGGSGDWGGFSGGGGDSAGGGAGGDW